MNDDASNHYELASPSAIPPTTSSYWVVPGRLLAGAYPGDSDPEAHPNCPSRGVGSRLATV
jgi:hypothetical protein